MSISITVFFLSHVTRFPSRARMSVTPAAYPGILGSFESVKKWDEIQGVPNALPDKYIFIIIADWARIMGQILDEEKKEMISKGEKRDMKGID